MRIVHAAWSSSALHLWAESSEPVPHGPGAHPAAAGHESLRALLAPFAGAHLLEDAHLTLRLPALDGAPIASPRLAHALGHPEVADAAHRAALSEWSVPALRCDASVAGDLLEAVEDAGAQGLEGHTFGIGDSITFFATVVRFVRYLLAQQRCVPSLEQQASGELDGLWQPWLSDDATVSRLTRIAGAMPPAARAAVDHFAHDRWSVLQDAVFRFTDAHCRAVMLREEMNDALGSRSPEADPHVAWLSGLLSDRARIGVPAQQRSELIRRVHRWLSVLEDRRPASDWRLCLKLEEPLEAGLIADFAAPDQDVRWSVSMHLQSVQRPTLIVPAEDIWILPTGAATVSGMRIESPQETLLAELGRAARLYKPLEGALRDAQPSSLDLSTSEAYAFLREVRPVLIEQGIHIIAPSWWDMPTIRLGARLRVDSESIEFDPEAPPASRAASSAVGLKSLVSYSWQLAIGNTTLTLEQFQRLAASHSPLVRLNGRWVEVRPEDLRAASDFLKKNPGGTMEVGRLLRLAYGSDPRQTGLPINGMDATGWVATVFGDAATNQALPMLQTPPGFIGALRPYQIKGLSWLAFLDRFGLGSCLADDMGLGKTIQLLALLAHERQGLTPEQRRELGPTLLVVPMSVVSNWTHEISRFTPELRVLVHHGGQRTQGKHLAAAATSSDVVVTTYSLAHRDRADLALVEWRRIVLDEAQNIKNPGAKQTQAIRSIPTGRRVALTGTPVENRLTELWSIMDFLNEGFLGPPADFRTRFALPIERYRDPVRAEQLRGLIQPFVLRRLKSDSSVIADLPQKIEGKEYCFLSPEQAQLYKTCVADMLSAAEKTEGIQRRGVILAGLIKLKQICNHPAQFFKEQAGGENDEPGASLAQPARSGKCLRLIEMLREVVEAGDRALVFTQFRQMGHLLAPMLRQALDRPVLFLHGGTPAKQREELVASFQSPVTNPGSTGGAPVFILSLKAGGLGLNLTAANHVFHFDRWWNPAVEAQATDRAYRIGQTRSVLVHKFIVSGTLEERIDQMIEQKTELAGNVIGAGEGWLTELSTHQLRELLTLQAESVVALAEEGEDA